MKKGIHPDYKTTTITCVNCGEEFEVGSTAKDIRVEVCSKCHPFYTGKETYKQAAGRVERFQKRYARRQAKEEAKETSTKEVKKDETEVKEETKKEPKADQKENQKES